MASRRIFAAPDAEARSGALTPDGASQAQSSAGWEDSLESERCISVDGRALLAAGWTKARADLGRPPQRAAATPATEATGRSRIDEQI